MLEVSLDWIEFTSYNFLTIDSFLSQFNYDRNRMIELPIGRYGYKNVLKVPDANIYFMFNGFECMGIHMSVSGSAIDTLCDHLGYECNYLGYDHVKLIKYLYLFGEFSRLDIALDDITAKYFSIGQLLHYLLENQYSGRFKEWSFIKSFEHIENSKDELIGDTIYLGRRKSDTFFRIYDKKLEHNYKLPDQKTDVECTRWELEAKGDGAKLLAKEICENDSLAVAFYGRLKNNFRLVSKDNRRKSRCSTLPKYEKFTQGIPRAKSSRSKKILDIDQKISWLVNQCSTSFAMACAVNPDFGELLNDIGSENLDQNKLNMIDAYNGG